MAKTTNWSTNTSANAEDFRVRIYFSDRNPGDDTRAKRARIEVYGTVTADGGPEGAVSKQVGYTFRIQSSAQDGDGSANGSNLRTPAPWSTASAEERSAMATAFAAIYREWRLLANSDVE